MDCQAKSDIYQLGKIAGVRCILYCFGIIRIEMSFDYRKSIKNNIEIDSEAQQN